ncbi:hypothetical protein BGZ54_004205, partial [Gamsiella multidivaricata]
DDAVDVLEVRAMHVAVASSKSISKSISKSSSKSNNTSSKSNNAYIEPEHVRNIVARAPF